MTIEAYNDSEVEKIFGAVLNAMKSMPSRMSFVSRAGWNGALYTSLRRILRQESEFSKVFGRSWKEGEQRHSHFWVAIDHVVHFIETHKLVPTREVEQRINTLRLHQASLALSANDLKDEIGRFKELEGRAWTHMFLFEATERKRMADTAKFVQSTLDEGHASTEDEAKKYAATRHVSMIQDAIVMLRQMRQATQNVNSIIRSIKEQKAEFDHELIELETAIVAMTTEEVRPASKPPATRQVLDTVATTETKVTLQGETE